MEVSMSDAVFSEEGDYFTFSRVFEKEPGLFEASILFERKSDHVHVRVPAMRHKLTTTFSDRNEAMQAALNYAREHAKSKDVGV
jgi:hypothetical protein